MNGNKVFADTNIILYLLGGDTTIAELLNGKQIYISFVTQLELLSYSKNTNKDFKIIHELLDQFVIIDINEEIKVRLTMVCSKKSEQLTFRDSIIKSLFQQKTILPGSITFD
jgi:predicted nucleic acid-binding protein